MGQQFSHPSGHQSSREEIRTNMPKYRLYKCWRIWCKWKAFINTEEEGKDRGKVESCLKFGNPMFCQEFCTTQPIIHILVQFSCSVMSDSLWPHDSHLLSCKNISDWEETTPSVVFLNYGTALHFSNNLSHLGRENLWLCWVVTLPHLQSPLDTRGVRILILSHFHTVSYSFSVSEQLSTPA